MCDVSEYSKVEGIESGVLSSSECFRLYCVQNYGAEYLAVNGKFPVCWDISGLKEGSEEF
jgi:hypothetical protein